MRKFRKLFNRKLFSCNFKKIFFTNLFTLYRPELLVIAFHLHPFLLIKLKHSQEAQHEVQSSCFDYISM